MAKDLKARFIKIKTPDNFLLNGFLLGSPKAKIIYIYVHGLDGNLFSQTELTTSLIGPTSAVIVFNNRGFGVINKIRKIWPKDPARYDARTMGWAHEVFTDCANDLEGAVQYAKNLGAKKIILVGHSTGCQKSAYYLAQRPQSAATGAVLLAPMSDFADTYLKTDQKIYRRALNTAKKLLAQGRGDELMPPTVWPDLMDAQRWLSLFTPDSSEEVFSYASGRRPIALLKNNKPLLIILGEKDRFTDRPMREIADWFNTVLKNKDYQLKIIKGADHYFLKEVSKLKKMITTWSLKY